MAGGLCQHSSLLPNIHCGGGGGFVFYCIKLKIINKKSEIIVLDYKYIHNDYDIMIMIDFSLSCIEKLVKMPVKIPLLCFHQKKKKK